MSIGIIYFVIYLIESLILLQYTSSFLMGKYKKYIEIPILLFGYTALYFISYTDNYILNAIAFFIVNFVFIGTMYKCQLTVAFFHATITTTVMCASELIVFNIITHYIPDFFDDSKFLFNLVILAVFSKFVYFIVVYVLSHFLQTNSKASLSQNKNTFLLALIPVATVFILLTLTKVSTSLYMPPSLDWMLCISSLLMLGLNLFIFAFHHHVQKENAKRIELELLLQKEFDSAEYYKMLLQQTENQKILIHDIKKHLQAIEILNNNREHEKIESYIRHLIHSSSLQNNYNLCENKVLNSILGQYKRQCSDKHIDFHVDVRYQTLDFLLTNDITALFCNLLDNALEAAEKTVDAYIELSVSHKQNTPYTIITITNACRQDPFDSNTSGLFTRKPDKQRHGYGLKSVQRIVKKYHGNITMYYEKETVSFHTVITLSQ